MTHYLDPVHPGEILAEEFPLGVTQYRLAKDTSVPARRINEIVKGERSISADTALRFAKYFGTSGVTLSVMTDLKLEETTLNTNPRPEVSDRGVDLTQIRRMLTLTPGERLRVGIANSNAAFKLFGRAHK
jgi:addiction module HigA family antidote